MSDLMMVLNEGNYLAAKAKMDDKPDDVCPGCGSDLSPWLDDPHSDLYYHTRTGVWLEWQRGPMSTCSWDADNLSMRALLRRMIRATKEANGTDVPTLF